MTYQNTPHLAFASPKQNELYFDEKLQQTY